MFRVAAVLSAGTTPDPLIRDLEEIAREYGIGVLVYVVYGKPLPGQPSSPYDMAVKVYDAARELGFSEVRVRGLPDPEDFDSCLRGFREVLEEVLGEGVEKLLVEYTGGTKVMSSALVYAALTSPFASVELRYVGGLRGKDGRVVDYAMRVKREFSTVVWERVRSALEAAKRYDYAKACGLLEGLRLAGRGLFAQRALRFLMLWDSFLYSSAAREARGLGDMASVLLDDRELGALAGTVYRLSRLAPRLAHVVSVLREVEMEQKPASAARDAGGHVMLSLDALENAGRRLGEERYSDAALRAYRAVEVAAQAVLVHRYGLSPWNPDWSVLGERLGRVREALGVLPDAIALNTALAVVEAVDGVSLCDRVRVLATIRNHSFLEHGYQETSRRAAERAMEVAEEVVGELAGLLGFDGSAVERMREELRHSV